MTGPNERDEIAAVLAAHVRADWSDRTFACDGCRRRFEDEHAEAWIQMGQAERTEHLSILNSHMKPNWTLADYHRHVADALTDLLAERDRRTAATALREAADVLEDGISDLRATRSAVEATYINCTRFDVRSLRLTANAIEKGEGQ